MQRGKQKKLENINDKKNNKLINNTKAPILFEHTSKIEQKLTYLKQKISEKKKISIAQKQIQLETNLQIFLAKISLCQYLPKLIENGIDSFDILREAKQSQLQEIGILKGHALKIVVNIKKQREKASRRSVITETNEGKIEDGSKYDGKQEEALTTAPTITKKEVSEIGDIQTESIPIQNVKKSFCLYCYSRSESNFCTPNCEMMYSMMFQKYQQNLHKAQQDFIPKQTQPRDDLSDNQQFLQNFDFLFNPHPQPQPQLEDFNRQQYQSMKQLMKR